MRRFALRMAGFLSLALGAIGAFLPLLPTVPFVLLAAFCFARSSPELEARLLQHPRYGPHLVAWRQSRSVSRKAKRAAWGTFALSAAIGLLTLPGWWAWIPAGVAVIGSTWIASLRTLPEGG
jgi:uncharacterized membrane protein YbaN (DUF454 family)